MPDTKSLRNRIRSVDSTLHLTKAMGLVASSKIRRATEAMNKGREYANSLQNVVDLLTVSPECKKSPYMQVRETGVTRLIAIAGDRGLAGGYNANVFRLAATSFYPKASHIRMPRIWRTSFVWNSVRDSLTGWEFYAPNTYP